MSGFKTLFGMTKKSRRDPVPGLGTVTPNSWETIIPDEAFRVALESIGITNETELNAATSINLEGYGGGNGGLAGANWEGIENATSLQTLNLVNTGCGGGLSKISAITSLTSLNLFNTTILGTLSSVGGLTNLTYLNLGDNANITGNLIDIDGLTGLTELILRNTGVGGFAVALSSLTNLTRILIYGTSVQGDVGGWDALTSLEAVYAHDTAISNSTSPAWTTQPNLAALHLHNNNLSQTQVDAVLADLEVSLGLTGRVTCSVRLEGNAAPSAAGEDDVATLVSAGWTVVTDSGFSGEAGTTLNYSVRTVNLTADEQTWRDRIWNSANAGVLSNFGAAATDDERVHPRVRAPLFGLATALACTGEADFLHWIDEIAEMLWDNLAYGFRSTDTNPDWNDGQHDLNNTSLLIWIQAVDNGSTDFFSNSNMEGTDLDYAHSEGRYMHFASFIMEIFRQNTLEAVPAALQYTRTSKETTTAPNGVAGLTAKTETTYGDKYERWKWWVFNHMLWKWNKRILEYEPFGSGQALDAPWGVDYMEGLDKTSYQGDGGDAIAVNYYLWKASGDARYKTAQESLTDLYKGTWCDQTQTTNAGRAGFTMPRLWAGRGSTLSPTDAQFDARPTVYYREDIPRLAHLAFVGAYGFADGSFMQRVNHVLADNVCYQGIPTTSSWLAAADVNGAAGTTLRWTQPGGTEVDLKQDGGFPEQGLDLWHEHLLPLAMPWSDDAGITNTFFEINEGAWREGGYGGTVDTPQRIGVCAGFLAYYTYVRLRAA